jgi:hypothetical protein
MAGSPSLEGLLILSERQGLFKGDLHVVQRIGLQGVINRELNDMAEAELYRVQMNALASNEATSGELIKSLWDDKTEEELIEEEVDWITPQSPEELSGMMKTLGLDLIGTTEDSD